jgi:four helix bundle protein
MARMLAVEVHRMTIAELPPFEMYEEGSQIRRSIKSVRSNIVEGYGRRRYKQDFIRFLVSAEASCDETVDHLDTLFETGSLQNAEIHSALNEKLRTLGRKLNCFRRSVESGHLSVKEDPAMCAVVEEISSNMEMEPQQMHPASGIRNPASEL